MYNNDENITSKKSIHSLKIPFITSIRMAICWCKLVLTEMFETNVAVKNLTNSSPTTKVKTTF